MHKHYCPCCKQIWDCNVTEPVLDYCEEDEHGNILHEEYFNCDDPNNYEYVCEPCSDAGFMSPTYQEFTQQFIDIGGIVVHADGTEEKRSLQ